MKATVRIHEVIKFKVYYKNTYCITSYSFKSAIKIVKEYIKHYDDINDNFYIFFETENTRILMATITAN